MLSLIPYLPPHCNAHVWRALVARRGCLRRTSTMGSLAIDQTLALAMARHGRLGASSSAASLQADTIEHIFAFVREAHKDLLATRRIVSICMQLISTGIHRIEISYSDGTHTAHGGHSGEWQRPLRLQPGEYITSVSGARRRGVLAVYFVYKVDFTTNLGATHTFMRPSIVNRPFVLPIDTDRESRGPGVHVPHRAAGNRALCGAALDRCSCNEGDGVDEQHGAAAARSPVHLLRAIPQRPLAPSHRRACGWPRHRSPPVHPRAGKGARVGASELRRVYLPFSCAAVRWRPDRPLQGPPRRQHRLALAELLARGLGWREEASYILKPEADTRPRNTLVRHRYSGVDASACPYVFSFLPLPSRMRGGHTKSRRLFKAVSPTPYRGPLKRAVTPRSSLPLFYLIIRVVFLGVLSSSIQLLV